MHLHVRIVLMPLLVAALAACSRPAPTAELPTSALRVPTGTAAHTPVATATTFPIPTATLQVSSIMLAGHSAPVTSVAWSPDTQLIATTAGDWDSTDPTIRLWRSDGSLITVLRGHTGPVRSLAWSPDGQLLATGSLDSTIRLWRTDGTLAATLRGGDPVVTVAWSPDGQRLASASSPTLNPVVRLWRRDGTPLAVLSTQYTGGKFYNLDWSPDGKYLLGGAIDYKVWRADGAEVFHLESCEFCTPAWGAAWSTDGSRWAIGNESGEVDIYDVEGHALAHMQNQQGNADALAWSPDGQVLAGGDGVNLWGKDGSLKVSHASFGRVEGLVWAADGKMLVSSSTGNGLRVWRADGKLLAAFPGSIINTAWSPEGQLLAAAAVENGTEIWRIDLGTLEH